MPRQLTVGKLRGLQQLSDRAGLLAMCAMDHRGSMQRLIDPAAPERVGYETRVEYKLDLTEALAPVSTAVLLDPIYGAAQAITGGVLPGETGLLVSLEETGYQSDAHRPGSGTPQGRVTTLLPDWGVDKARKMGASAVKILLYYRPGLAENALHQRQVTRRVGDDAARAASPSCWSRLRIPLQRPSVTRPRGLAARRTWWCNRPVT